MARKKYFATLPTEEIASDLVSRVSSWYDYIRISGQFGRMRRSYNTYYGYGSQGIGSSSEVTQGGEQGELSLVKVNHFRNLIQHILVMTVQNRPAMEARAVNTDYRSLAQTVLANGILDYYMREKKLERILKTATEIALIFGEGYIRLEWDATSGEEYTVDTGDEPTDEMVANSDLSQPQEVRQPQIVYSGDLKYSALNPIDVIKDLYVQDPNDQDWIIVRHFKNKYDLSAKYPDLEDEIVSIDISGDDILAFDFTTQMAVETDLIPIYEFYHRKSDAVPDGRLVVFLNDSTVLFDGPLPYQGIPVYRIAPGDFIGTAHGYSPAFDLLGLQESLDALYSTVITNQSTFGVQNIMIMKGHNIAYTQLSGGMNLIEYDNEHGKPEPLNLTYTPPEIFNFINKLEQTMETLSGVNSVARGNPEANLRSGNALALIQSMAIQFNSGLQQSYAQLLEDVGTSTIKTLQQFAHIPRLAMITGKSTRPFLREFKSSDIADVDRIVVDVGNPLAKTIAGKMEIADNLLQMGQINARQYISIIKTGNLDVLLEDDFDELMNIKDENEALSEGKSDEVIAIATDNHSTHIKMHKAVLNLAARKDKRISGAVLDHINEHLNLLRNTDPGLLMLLGEQPLPPPQPQGGPADAASMMGMGGPQEAPPTPGAQGNAAAAMNPTNPSAQVPGLPSMPKNPLSGEKWNPQNGGLPQG